MGKRKKLKLTEAERDRLNMILSYLEIGSELEEIEDILNTPITQEDLDIISQDITIKRRSHSESIRVYTNRGETNIVIDYQNKIATLKVIAKNFQDMKVKHQKKTGSINKISESSQKPKYNEKKHLIENIERVDYTCSEEAKKLFEEYKKSGFFAENIQLLNQLQSLYYENSINLSQYHKEALQNIYDIVASSAHLPGKLKKNKKHLYDLLNTEEFTPLKEKLEYLTIKYHQNKQILENIQKLIKYEQNNIKALSLKEFTNEELKELPDTKADESSLSLEFKQVINGLLNGKYMRKYGPDINPLKIPELQELLEKLDTINTSEKTELIVLAIDMLRNKRKSIRRGTDDKKKQFLKTVEKKFKSMKPIPEYMEEENTEPYYNIMISLIEDDRNFGYIKRLVKEVNGFKQARKQVKNLETEEKENEHILLNVLDKFIYNYKLKLVNQGFTYIEPDFYRAIMNLYFEEGVSLSSEESCRILERLEDFNEYAIEKHYQTTSTVLNEIEELKNKLTGCKTEDKEVTVEDRNIKKELAEISPYIHQEAAMRNKKLGYQEYKETEGTTTFMLDQIPNYAFSLRYTETGETHFGIHILDNRNLINMDEIAQEQIKAGKKVLPEFHLQQLCPTMSFTYQIKDNKLGKLKIEPASITISTLYNEQNLDEYRTIPELKDFFRVINKLKEKEEYPENIYQQAGIHDLIEQSLSKDIGNKFDGAHIPFVYEKPLDEVDDLIRSNHNKTCCDLFNIPKQQAHYIFDILDTPVDTYYMTNRGQNGKIETTGNTYLGMYLLDTLYKIKNLTPDGIPQYNPDEAATEVLDIVTELNKNNTYIPKDVSRSNDKNIKKMVRAYKKSQ